MEKKRLVIKETIDAPILDASRKRWNEEFITILEKLVKLMAAKGEVFKSRAYKKAEETIRGTQEDIVEVKQLKGKPGIGDTILKKLQEYVNTGTLALIEREKDKPEYLFSEIHGVGPKKAIELVEKGVKTIAELRERQDELLNDVQKKGLKYFEDVQLKIPRKEIDEYKAIFEEAFKKAAEGTDANMEIVGSYRRGAKESGDIDVIITATDPEMFSRFTKMLTSTGIILETLSCGKTKCLVITKLPDRQDATNRRFARRVDFMYTSPEEYPFAVLYFTGSKTFNTVMRGNALKMGFSLNEHGIYKKEKGKEKEEKIDHVFKNEKDIFDFLKMDYREPTQRREPTSSFANPSTPLPLYEKVEIGSLITQKKRGRPKKEGTKKIREEKPKKEKPLKEEKPKKEKPLKEEKPKKERSKKVREPKENGTLKKRGRPKKQPVLVEPIFPEKISSNEGFSEPRSGIEKPRSSRDVTDRRSVKSPEDDDKKVEEEIPIVPIVPLEVIAEQNVENAVKKRGRPKKVKAVVGLLPSFKEMIKKSPRKEIKVSHNKSVRNMSDKTKAKKNLIDFKKSGISLLALLSEKEIESMVVTANDAYYNSKNPLLTDNEYDIVREYAEAKYPNNETIKHVGAPITKNKVTLPYNMPSMDKIKPDTNALSNWMQKYTGPYVLSCKLDGVSGLYTTEGPEPKLYTRGDGKIGQDVSHLLRVLKLPLKAEGEKGYAVRGEFIIPKRVFDEKYKDQFANPRNLVSGIVNSKTLDDKTKDLHFVTYEVINPPMKVGEQMETLKKLGHEVVKNERKTTLSNDELSKTLLDWRANYEYEVDGVIVADDNIHPRKDGNPEYAFAFKMVISDQMAEAKVVDVLWEPSKSGYLKPRVQIEPIKLGGVTIQYATGFNGDFIEKNKIGIGAVIQLVRSGDVIPHIKSVTTPAETAKMPDQTYTWTKNHVDIVLENVAEDVTVKRKNIVEFFTKLEVDGLSGKTVEKIMDASFDTIPKILKMSKTDFAKVKGFKETMINKIHDGIKVQVEKATLLDIMAASNMFGRGIGERKIKPILEAEPTILTDVGTQEQKYERLIKIKGIGQENAQSFTKNIDRFMEFLKECELEHKLTEGPKEETKKVDVSHPLYEKHIVMSGVRDATVKEKLESVGGVLDDSIGSKTFVLVVKSKESETSKTKYAKANGIEIMEPVEFLAKYFA